MNERSLVHLTGKLGVLICWDQWYPEAARLAALAGAQLLLSPTAIGWHPAEQAEWGEKQRDAFRQQLRLAKTVGLPTVVHTREAEDDTIDILRTEDAASSRQPP